MCDPHGQPNLLTGAATDTWKAIRRAVAVSFSTQNIRKKYPLVLSRINEVRRGAAGGRARARLAFFLVLDDGGGVGQRAALAQRGSRRRQTAGGSSCPSALKHLHRRALTRTTTRPPPPPQQRPQRNKQLVARCAALGPEASIDVDQAALRVTLDVIGLAGFGHDYQSVKQDKPAYDHLLRVLPRCFTEVMLRIANPARQLVPGAFKGGDKGSKAYEMFQAEMRILLEELKARGPPAADDHDIASQLYRVMAENPDVSEDRVISEIGILFVEGFETTGHTTAWTLLHAATSPGVQERVAAELDAAGLLAKPGVKPREMEFEDLKKLPFLTAVAKEAMRMLPVVSLMGRVTDKPTKIGGYTVPAGVVVGTPLYAIHVRALGAF